MGVENTMFSWGGEWQDPATNEVLGIVNSDANVEALQAYKDLYDCCQVPGLSNAFFTETNDAMISGQAAMIMNYFAFFPALANPGVSPYADVTKYFPNPAGPYGDQHAALGGQGMSIISYISPERQEAMKDFIRWFAQDDVQAEWAALGGYSCNAAVLETQEFLDAQPFNPAFAETMTFVKDFWNIPVYGDLLEVTQREFSEFVVEGVGTAQETMDTIAEEHNEILVDSGFISE
jgi:multiple sugar transport system substrate-binding protein